MSTPAPAPTASPSQNSPSPSRQLNEKGLLGPGPQASAGLLSLDPSSSYAQSEMPTKTNKASGSGPSLEGIKTRTVYGPDGKSVTIVDVPCPEPPPQRKFDPDAPLFSLRIKKKRNSSGQTKQGISVATTTKALQIWSPKKDKKNKPRDKLVSLTLQEIEAWSLTTRSQSTAHEKVPTETTAPTGATRMPSLDSNTLAKDP
ncbi:unnamed protein product [Linum trigynum]|uniref:Uncharacterized protein n=1 Tax=Linum trigynum TaxID=586398 RepID=A0AAV2CVF2_9ROSI